MSADSPCQEAIAWLAQQMSMATIDDEGKALNYKATVEQDGKTQVVQDDEKVGKYKDKTLTLVPHITAGDK